jgi:hypothetical protein
MTGFMNCLRRARGLGQRLFVLSVLAIAIVVLSPMASASILNGCPVTPGQTIILAGCDATTALFGTLLASVSTSFTGITNTGVVVYSGTLISAVYREAGGTLDFYYQEFNNATAGTVTGTTGCGHGGAQAACDPIARETDSNFATWITNLAFRTDGALAGGGTGFVNGTVPPVTGDRNSPGGDVIGFSFSPPDSAKILPGTTSNVLIISTNALFYNAGSASVIDGATTTVAAYEPSTGLPEPASFALLGLGLVVVAGYSRRLKNRRV